MQLETDRTWMTRKLATASHRLAGFLIIVTSVLMYLLRPRGKDVENLDDLTDFESISSTMVLSVLMLTGQGGPEGQLPWYTQIVVLLTGLFLIAMFATPVEMRKKYPCFLDNANKMNVFVSGVSRPRPRGWPRGQRGGR